MNPRFFGAIGAALLASTILVAAQTVSPPPPVMPAPVADNNAFPDFGYHEAPGWAKLPAGRKWGGVSGIDIDRDGKSVWVFDRCESPDDGCVTHPNDDPILKFDSTGKLVKSFGHARSSIPTASMSMRRTMSGSPTAWRAAARRAMWCANMTRTASC